VPPKVNSYSRPCLIKYKAVIKNMDKYCKSDHSAAGADRTLTCSRPVPA
jgi:hypothetical protein